MSEPVTVATRDGVAVITIDNPPVNALDVKVVAGLTRAFDQVAQDPAARAVVVRCAGRTFIAGADIKELEDAAWNPGAEPPDLHDLLQRM
jgi:3-hydroxyacyl-CoA dehydrogenase